MRVSFKRAGITAGMGALLLGAFATSGALATSGTANAYLLCGTQTAPTDDFSGASSIDHPSGSASGKVYSYATYQRCEDANSKGSSSDMFNWTVNHSNVHQNAGNPQNERGTEHGILTATVIADTKNVGFNGQITDYDFGDTADTCAGSDRHQYYASGRQDPNVVCGTPSGPGNINTHGGADTMQHFHGKYGSTVFTYDHQNSTGQNDSPCPTNQSTTFCFEAVLAGTTN